MECYIENECCVSARFVFVLDHFNFHNLSYRLIYDYTHYLSGNQFATFN